MLRMSAKFRPGRVHIAALILLGLLSGVTRAQCPALATLFGLPLPYPAPAGSWLTKGDFDDDGYVDLVVTGTGNSVGIMRGLPTGGFGPATSFPIPGGVTGNRNEVLDYDGDGILDIAVGGGVSTVGPGSVAFLQGVGSGGTGTATFVPGPVVQLPSLGFGLEWPIQLHAADLNKDGIPDLLMIRQNSLVVMMGHGASGRSDGTWTFLPPLAFTHGSPGDFTIGDFNEDGILDIAVVYALGGMEVLLGQGTGNIGTGTFASSQWLPFPGSSGLAIGIVATDFDNDSILDLAAVDHGPVGYVYVSHGLGTSSIGNGTFTAPVAYPVGNYPVRIVTGDFNYDGRADLAVARDTTLSLGGGTNLSILIAQAPGGFAPYLGLSANAGGPFCILADDTNHDGHVDLIVLKQVSEVDVLQGACLTSPANPIVVTNPPPGVIWPAGSDQYITWTRPNTTPLVDVAVSRDGGGNFEVIASGTCELSLQWHVTDPSSSQAIIRVSDSTAPTRFGASSGFSIQGAWTAQALPWGGGCGPNAPLFTATTPLIGQSVVLTLTGGAPLVSGEIFAGPPAATPPLILGGCTLAFDPAFAIALIPLLTDAQGHWTAPVLIANEPRLAGFEIALQVALATPLNPPGYQISTGVRALLGY